MPPETKSFWIYIYSQLAHISILPPPYLGILKIINSLLEDNVRHLPYYAIDELMEEIVLAISQTISQREKELFKEIMYILKHSPRCLFLINELLA